MIIHRKLSKMKNKIFPTCLQGNYGDSLGEFSNMSYMYGMFGADRVKVVKVYMYICSNSALDNQSELTSSSQQRCWTHCSRFALFCRSKVPFQPEGGRTTTILLVLARCGGTVYRLCVDPYILGM